MRRYLSIFIATLITSCSTCNQVINWDDTVSFDKISYNAITRETDNSIIANIHGISAIDQTVYYHVNWYDVNGMPIDTVMSSCSRQQIHGDKAFDWKIVAPSNKAKSFNVFVSSKCKN